jgi:dynamin GTPase
MIRGIEIGKNPIALSGYLSKQSAKTDQWTKRWFVLNEKTAKFSYTKKPEEKHFRGVINLEECLIEDATEADLEEAPAEQDKKKSSTKDKKNANGDASKIPASSLAFKISNKVPYKTVLKAHHSIILKADNMADKLDWMSRLRKCMGSAPSKESEPTSKKGSTLKTSSSAPSLSESNPSLRAASDGPVEPVFTRPLNPEEDLKLMAQEVRDYVEAVLNSLSANVPKAVVLCQVERSKDSMLPQLYSAISSQSTAKIQELLLEDQSVKKRREKVQRQADLLTKLTRQLSIHEARASNAESYSVDANGSPAPKVADTEDWRLAFEEAGGSSKSTGPSPRGSRRENGDVSSRYSDNDENGDVGSQSSRRTPSRLPPPPPGSNLYNRY